MKDAEELVVVDVKCLPRARRGACVEASGHALPPDRLRWRDQAKCGGYCPDFALE